MIKIAKDESVDCKSTQTDITLIIKEILAKQDKCGEERFNYNYT